MDINCDEAREKEACMGLVLAHELAHSFGLEEQYGKKIENSQGNLIDHDVSDGFVCIMEAFEDEYAWIFYSSLLENGQAFCNSCKEKKEEIVYTKSFDK